MAAASPRPTVLFLCTGNSCRSQMAEGWARHLHGDRIQALSAGVEPKGIDPRAARVMEEVGVDVTGQGSTHVDELLDRPVDLVITVCDSARETCPLFPRAARTVHRSFDDPPRLAEGVEDEDAALAPYRRVRDEIRGFVEGLPGLL